MVSGTPTLRVGGRNIVTLNTSQVRQITDGQSISYSDHVLTVSTSGSVNVFTQTNIGQFAIFTTGCQQLSTFTSSSPISMRRPGTLYYDGSRAFFTDRTEITDAISNALTPATTQTPMMSVTTPTAPTCTSSPSPDPSGTPPTEPSDGPTTSDGSRWVIGSWSSVSVYMPLCVCFCAKENVISYIL